MPALWVLPSIDRMYGDACLATLRVANVLRIDNTINNLGVPRSWNVGVSAALGMSAEWLILCSESMRFGPAGGLDLEAQLEGDCVTTFNSGWHLIALHMAMIYKVGLFDAYFSPCYYEDSDYMRRMLLAGFPLDASDRVKQIAIDCAEIDIAHTLVSGRVKVDYGDQLCKYEAKWGGSPGEEQWEHPFNNADNDWTSVAA